MSANIVYRLRQLASTKNHHGILPVSPATLWRWVRDGKFPKPYRLGERCTVWDATDVDEWLALQRKSGSVQ